MDALRSMALTGAQPFGLAAAALALLAVGGATVLVRRRPAVDDS